MLLPACLRVINSSALILGYLRVDDGWQLTEFIAFHSMYCILYMLHT